MGHMQMPAQAIRHSILSGSTILTSLRQRHTKKSLFLLMSCVSRALSPVALKQLQIQMKMDVGCRGKFDPEATLISRIDKQLEFVALL